MKLDLFEGSAGGSPSGKASVTGVTSETDRLTDVLLCRPTYLEAVPCCAVTCESLNNGFTLSVTEATRQHTALEALLEANGVTTQLLRARPGMPDMCFTRDSAVMTPWGLLGLNPAATHRDGEAAHLLDHARSARIPTLGAVEVGTVEGGDVCILRDGFVVVGWSGERTDLRGAQAVCEIFQAAGWRAITYRFAPHFLHLDTQFCMVDDGLALACTDVLDNEFIRTIEGEGVELVPVTYKESQRLGCNLLALGGGRVIASTTNARVTSELRRRGIEVDTVDVSQFEHCGGGIHCLTMPVARAQQSVGPRSVPAWSREFRSC